jgi:hypothetical protein
MVELYYPYDSNLMFSKIRKMKWLRPMA